MPRAPRVLNRHGRAIQSLDDWRDHAGPASANHWKDGRSAKELAKAWLNGDGPAALGRLLDSGPETHGLVIEEAIAEAQVAFDSYPGGRRNHDLLLRGRVAEGPIVIGLEAKADETFGGTVGAYESRAKALRSAGKATNAPERLAGLMDDIAAATLATVPAFAGLRYQLFSAIAGTLAAARGDEIAAFVVHEFATSLTTEKKRKANMEALKHFVEDLTGAVVPPSDWWLLGPFYVPAERWSKTPLWIGHLSTPGSGT